MKKADHLGSAFSNVDCFRVQPQEDSPQTRQVKQRPVGCIGPPHLSQSLACAKKDLIGASSRLPIEHLDSSFNGSFSFFKFIFNTPPFFWVLGFCFLVRKNTEPNGGQEEQGSKLFAWQGFFEAAHHISS